MKNLIFTSVFAFFSLASLAQDVAGSWKGTLQVPGGKLNVVFHLVKEGEKISGTMDSPDQGVKGIPVTLAEVRDSVLHLGITSINATYAGKWNAAFIEGEYKQNGITIPLKLERTAGETPKANRPQVPKAPFSYYTEDVKFVNSGANITLAGTLSMPAKTGKYPVVVLISGSGPQNRDEELLGHKPFLVLADHLTKNGIAVLRFDDRGTGESTGEFGNAITPDFATDVTAAINFLKTRPEIDPKKIGLIGHSEGGLIAPMIAAKSSDVNFIVLLAGPGIPGDEILVLQSRLIGKANGLSNEILDKGDITNKKIYGALKGTRSDDDINRDLTNILDEAVKELPANQQPPADRRDAAIAQAMKSINTPWNKFFINHDPAPVLEKVKCPVLALNGEKDLQVPARVNLEAIGNALEKAENRKYTVKELPKLNHLFQESITGSPADYGSIEQTFSPLALTEISNWITGQVKK